MSDSDLLTPNDIERLAAAIGLSMADVCRAAGIAHSTWSRWRNGETEPTLSVYRRIRAAVSPPSVPQPARRRRTKTPAASSVPAEAAG